jgi:anti-sigma regulatory factor (Ser/Thr protein kinase)
VISRADSDPTSSSVSAVVELRLEARPENVALARLALSGVAAVASATPDETADLRLAVSEACTRAVTACRDRKDGRVVVRYSVVPGLVTIEVEDDGDAVDDSEGALELAIAAAVTDLLLVERHETGNRVVLSKRLAGADDVS